MKQISLIYFRVYLEVYVVKNPTCFSRWSVRVGENSGTVVDCGDICIVTTADNKEYITIAWLEYKDDNKFGKELVFINVPYDIISVKVLKHYYEVNKDTKIGSISYIKL